MPAQMSERRAEERQKEREGKTPLIEATTSASPRAEHTHHSDQVPKRLNTNRTEFNPRRFSGFILHEDSGGIQLGPPFKDQQNILKYTLYCIQ